MSLRKLVHITAICDGPCGTCVEIESPKVPDGWMLVHVMSPNHVSGESPIKLTGAFCPKCTDRFYQTLRHEGYSFVKKDEEAVKP